jgi:CO/xanthine dehydrogenase FAD-binding subunit
LMGVGETPLRADGAEALLRGQELSDTLLEDAAASIRSAIEPNTDLHASSDYRRHLAGVLAKKAVKDAWRRASGGRQ